MRFVLQLLFPAQLVFLQLDKDASFSPPDKVDELSIFCSKDDPENRREIRLKDAPRVRVCAAEAELSLGLGLPGLDAQFADVDPTAAPPV